ncbi:MAG: hypothetical protein ACLGIR_11790 [Actinomycetes bacterium]
MRGDVELQLRLLRRPAGIAGVVGCAGGVGALVAAYLPWYEVAATVEMLGGERTRAVATLAGWQAHPWSWVVPVLGLLGAAVLLAEALDHPLPGSRDLGLVAALGLGVAAAVGGATFPPVTRFDVAGSRLRELSGLADRLPSDVALAFAVRPGPGLWWTAGSAVVVVASVALVARWR